METKHKLIGLCGKMRSGKSTLSEYLCIHHGYIEVAFAEPIKEMAKQFSFTNEQLYGNKKEDIDKTWGITPREVFQFIGRTFKAQYGEEVFVKMTKQKVIKLLENGNKVVISDIRFPAEEQFIKELGGTIIKIVRQQNEDVDEKISVLRNDISETNVNIISHDHLIENNSTVEDLHLKLNEIILTIQK